MTPFEGFMSREHITAASLSRASGVSLRHIMDIKKGRSDASMTIGLKLLTAARFITKRRVDIEELFQPKQPPLEELSETA